MLLIIGVIGSIYGGIASATEAAVVGVFGIAPVVWSGHVDRRGFRLADGRDRHLLHDRLYFRRCCVPDRAMGFTGIPRALAEWITGFGLPPLGAARRADAFYIVLGCFLDGISMVVLTTSSSCRW